MSRNIETSSSEISTAGSINDEESGVISFSLWIREKNKMKNKVFISTETVVQLKKYIYLKSVQIGVYAKQIPFSLYETIIATSRHINSLVVIQKDSSVEVVLDCLCTLQCFHFHIFPNLQFSSIKILITSMEY